MIVLIIDQIHYDKNISRVKKSTKLVFLIGLRIQVINYDPLTEIYTLFCKTKCVFINLHLLHLSTKLVPGVF